MIGAEDTEALSIASDLSKKEIVELELTVEEQAVLYALDSKVSDKAAYCLPGSMFEFKVEREVTAATLAALRRDWEAAGWVVGAFLIPDPETGTPLRDQTGPPDEAVYRLVFARPHRETGITGLQPKRKELRQAEEYIPIEEATANTATIVATAPRTSIPLLVRMPTRNRPRQALEVLEKYREMAIGEVTIEVVIDEDDETCNNTQFHQRLAELDCYVTVGRHKTKIEACNAGRMDDWAILLLASDDMVPIVRGYDQRIITAMEQHFPLRDGALCFNDGYNKDHVRPGEPVTCTLPIIGRHLYEMTGRRVYHSEYRSIYCDTDQTYLFTKMERLAFVDEVIIEHRHFANFKARFDELYEHNSQHDNHDKQVFERRRTEDFGRGKPILSILICAIPARRQRLERLVDYLRHQIRVFTHEHIEICVDLDEHGTVGEKRQRLLLRATGGYIAFIDDDDWVSRDYVSRVVQACWQEADCCSLTGVITEDGANPARFEHSISYLGWRTRDDGTHERTPNHLNAVKRELALKAGFASKNVGEDHEYSSALRPLLQSEASTGAEPLYYYWSVPSKSVQRRTNGA